MNMRDYKEIKKIEHKYGVPYFRMGLSYLFGKGHENVPEIDMDDARKLFEEKEKKLKEENERDGTHRFSVMTVDFQLQLIECAKELANIPMWDLFAYIKDEVSIEGCIDTWRVVEAVQDIQFDYNRLSEDGKYQMDKLKEVCGLIDEEEMEINYEKRF